MNANTLLVRGRAYAGVIIEEGPHRVGDEYAGVAYLKLTFHDPFDGVEDSFDSVAMVHIAGEYLIMTVSDINGNRQDIKLARATGLNPITRGM